MMGAPEGIGQMAALYSKAYRREVRRQCFKVAGMVAIEILVGITLINLWG